MNTIRRTIGPCAVVAGLVWSSCGLAAQVGWTDVTPVPMPPERVGCAMAFDSTRGVAVMFGGINSAGHLGDTWEWDGSVWTQLSPSPAPSARRYSRMAFDTARGVMVLFGGELANGTRMNDTWEWDGATWTARTFTTKPSGRNGHGFAYDIARQRVVLFGGTPNGPDETWEYDGSAWLQRVPNPKPGARQNAAMAYDSLRQRVVLFGGVVAGPTYYNDTWEWDGTTWTLRAPAHKPSTRQDSGMAYDAMRGRIVLHGGYRAGLALGETWDFDGVDWVQRTTTLTPGLRYQFGMAWDSARRVAVLALGYNGTAYTADTWTFGPIDPPEYASIGSGCAGSAGVPAITTSDLGPFASDVFTIQVSNVPAPELGATVGLLGFRDDLWGALTLPAELTDIGMPGCTLRNDLGALWVLPVAGNVATWDLLIPATEPPLVGLVFFQQALCFDPSANAAGMILSNQGRGVVGGR